VCNHFEASDWSNIVGVDRYAGREIFFHGGVPVQNFVRVLAAALNVFLYQLVKSVDTKNKNSFLVLVDLSNTYEK
jgi:hypothetical protein